MRSADALSRTPSPRRWRCWPAARRCPTLAGRSGDGGAAGRPSALTPAPAPRRRPRPRAAAAASRRASRVEAPVPPSRTARLRRRAPRAARRPHRRRRARLQALAQSHPELGGAACQPRPDLPPGRQARRGGRGARAGRRRPARSSRSTSTSSASPTASRASSPRRATAYERAIELDAELRRARMLNLGILNDLYLRRQRERALELYDALPGAVAGGRTRRSPSGSPT